MTIYSPASETGPDVTRRSQTSTHGRTIPRPSFLSARSALNGVGFRGKSKPQRRAGGNGAILGIRPACGSEVSRRRPERKGPRRLLQHPRSEEIRRWTEHSQPWRRRTQASKANAINRVFAVSESRWPLLLFVSRRSSCRPQGHHRFTPLAPSF